MKKTYEERIMDLRKEEAILAQKLDDVIERGKQQGIKISKEKGMRIGEEERKKRGCH